MKRLMAVLVLVGLMMVAAPVSFAGQMNTGCGVGTMIMKGQEGLLFQVLAVTTNGILGNQTFGITTGTVDCKKATSFASNERLNIYVAENMDNLANDIAKGQGEYLNTLAVLMEVPETNRSVFYTKLQNNFGAIYTSSNVTSVDVLNNIETLM
jgi:hypothetical protein